MSEAPEYRPEPPPRTAALVLVDRTGTQFGYLPPVPVETPWWNHAEPVVAAVRERYGIEIVILRLLAAERDGPGGAVTYLAETADRVAAEPRIWDLDEHALRQPYARPGGPDALLAWAETELAKQGLALIGRPRQVRTWNLSTLWCLPTSAGPVWLKAVPPFFAHEGSVIEKLEGFAVPRLIARDNGRILVAEIPGEDLYDAPRDQLLVMVGLLVEMQAAFVGRVDELLGMGLPDWRGPALTRAIAAVLKGNREWLDDNETEVLGAFVAGLPQRFAEIAACGIPDTLVHGDFHEGNTRGISTAITVLDWGDSGVGHPMLDLAAFMEWVPAGDQAAVRHHWSEVWRAHLPGSDPQRAAGLLVPLAAARQAVIYQSFLDGIEPSERVYHRNDPALWLKRTAKLVKRER